MVDIPFVQQMKTNEQYLAEIAFDKLWWAWYSRSVL